MNGLNLIFILLVSAFALLIGFWLYDVIQIRRPLRLALLLLGAAVFLLAGILFGGQRLLEAFGVTWRQWVRVALAVLLWLSGLAVSCLTVYCVPRALRSKGEAFRCCLQAVAVLCVVVAMGIGTIAGGLWLGPASEEVIEYRGEKAVQEDSRWLDESRVIYEYRGPFVRGTEAIGPIGG